MFDFACRSVYPSQCSGCWLQAYLQLSQHRSFLKTQTCPQQKWTCRYFWRPVLCMNHLPLSKLCHHCIRKTRICSWTRRLCWWPGQMCFNQDNRRRSDCFLLQTRPHWSQDVNVALAGSSKSNQIHFIVIKWLIWPIGLIATCSCNFI